MTRALMAASLLLGGGCVESIDLRPSPPACGPDQRLDGTGFTCRPCRVDADPPCACGVVRHAAPFPYCEGADVARECKPCTGGIESCVAWDAANHTTTDCALLQACCRDLADDATSTPCCLRGLEVVCTPSVNLGQYELRCVDPTCCAAKGTACPNSDGPCAPWQTCDPGTGTCIPACHPASQACGASCVCE